MANEVETKRVHSKPVLDHAWVKKGEIKSDTCEVIYWHYIYNCYFFNPNINSKELFQLLAENKDLPEEKTTTSLLAQGFRDHLTDVLPAMETHVVYQCSEHKPSYINVIFKLPHSDSGMNEQNKPKKTFVLNIHFDKSRRPKNEYADAKDGEETNIDVITAYIESKLKEFCAQISSTQANKTLKSIRDIYTKEKEEEERFTVTSDEFKLAKPYAPPQAPKIQRDFSTVRAAPPVTPSKYVPPAANNPPPQQGFWRKAASPNQTQDAPSKAEKRTSPPKNPEHKKEDQKRQWKK